LEGTKREGFTFVVGSGYNLHQIDDDVLGMKKEEERVIEKEYPEDMENSDLAGRKIRLKVRLTALKETQLPEIDDELAQDVSDDYQTLDDLKKSITERLEETRANRLREHKIDQMMEQVVENSTIVFPESMVERDMEYRWQEFVRRMGGNEEFVLGMLRQQERSREDLLAEWRPDVEETIKRRVAIQEIAEAEKTVVEDSDVEQQISRIAESQDRPVEEMKSELEQTGYIEAIREERRLAKTYDNLLETAKIKKGKKTPFLDFVQGNR
jgi:trigger factor